jgi:hypothetical protein
VAVGDTKGTQDSITSNTTRTARKRILVFIDRLPI